MLLVRKDDNCLYVYPTVDDVAMHIEALDADFCLREVYDTDGFQYSIEWVHPNVKSRHLFGLITSYLNGAYRLVRSASPDLEGLRRLVVRYPFAPDVPEARKRQITATVLGALA